MINGISPHYVVYPICIIPGQEEWDMTHLLTYCHPYLLRLMMVTRYRIRDGIIPFLIVQITHLQLKMRSIKTFNLKSNGTPVNNRFNLNWHLERTIIILIMVLQLPTTRVMEFKDP